MRIAKKKMNLKIWNNKNNKEYYDIACKRVKDEKIIQYYFKICRKLGTTGVATRAENPN